MTAYPHRFESYRRRQNQSILITRSQSNDNNIRMYRVC